jgi:hypothetical protein
MIYVFQIILEEDDHGECDNFIPTTSDNGNDPGAGSAQSPIGIGMSRLLTQGEREGRNQRNLISRNHDFDPRIEEEWVEKKILSEAR